MKKILMSIHPEWCEKIFNGEKTIEVRKTRPKLEPPFEVYVYCTRSRLHLYKNPNNGEVFLDRIEGYRGGDYENRYITGKVIGSFVCDDISPIDYIRYWNNGIEIDTCLSYKQVADYGKGKPLYGWHITESKLFDRPRELGEFRPWCEKSRKTDDNLEMCCNCKNAFFDEDDAFYGCGFTRAPQSWVYVEEE